MSNLIMQPPASIPLGGPGGPGGPGAGPGGPLGAGPGGPSANGPGDPDSGTVTDLLKKALKLVDQAATNEQDPTDEAAVRSIAQSISKVIANEQGLVDKAMGAGPGVKLVRKAAGGGAPSGGGY